jgi:hypothetical protein
MIFDHITVSILAPTGPRVPEVAIPRFCLAALAKLSRPDTRLRSLGTRGACRYLATLPFKLPIIIRNTAQLHIGLRAVTVHDGYTARFVRAP